MRSEQIIDIGNRLELFVDEHLIDEMIGGAALRLHRPTPREVAVTTDKPWEGNMCGYVTVFRDTDVYRMYYKAWQLTIRDGKLIRPHPLFACYAESRDGIHWRKPDLGLFAYGGDTKNNIVLATGRHGPVDVDAGHIAVFKDENPDCPPEVRYKAIVRSRRPSSSCSYRRAASLTESRVCSAMLVPPTRTARLSGLSRAPSHAGQSCTAISLSSSCLILSEVVSR